MEINQSLQILPQLYFSQSSQQYRGLRLILYDHHLILLHQLQMTQFAVFHLVILATVTLALAPQYPVIGVYTQIDEYDQPSTKQFLSTYISAAYVKFVQMSGAQVVPIFAFSNSSQIQAVLRKVNGVLFTGGAGQDQINIDNRWVKNANFIFQFAINQNTNGRVFPIWGTCLGFELLSYLTYGFDPNVVGPISGADHMLNVLKLQETSYLYDDLDSSLRSKLTAGPGIVYFNHQDGLKQSSFKNSKLLNNFWKATSTTRSKTGQIYVSTLESKDYPFFAVQFHPEKNLYEWRIQADRTDAGALVSQILSNKFVQFARQNSNRFQDINELNKMLIYNYKTTTTNLSYLRIYPFKQPRPDDWPYSLRYQ